MTVQETKQSEKGSAYVLTQPERQCLTNLHSAIVSAKAKMHDAQFELMAAQQAFNGGLGLLANSHGLGGGQLTPDFAAIIAAEGLANG